MTTYAPVPAFADGKRHPRALVLIVAGHAALLAAVMTAKMDLPMPFAPTPTTVELIAETTPPPELPPPPQPRRADPAIDRVRPIVPIPQPSPPLEVVPLPQPLPNPGPGIGAGKPPDVAPAPVRTGPHFVTPESQIKPPYPQSKLRLDEEAVLRLRLTIDSRGRVTAVEPVGGADPTFLAAARRHITARWRYKPATEDGRAIASSTVVTLRFELD